MIHWLILVGSERSRIRTVDGADRISLCHSPTAMVVNGREEGRNRERNDARHLAYSLNKARTTATAFGNSGVVELGQRKSGARGDLAHGLFGQQDPIHAGEKSPDAVGLAAIRSTRPRTSAVGSPFLAMARRDGSGEGRSSRHAGPTRRRPGAEADRVRRSPVRRTDQRVPTSSDARA